MRLRRYPLINSTQRKVDWNKKFAVNSGWYRGGNSRRLWFIKQYRSWILK